MNQANNAVSNEPPQAGSIRERIVNYLRAGYGGLYLVSSEDQRVEFELKAVATYLAAHPG